MKYISIIFLFILYSCNQQQDEVIIDITSKNNSLIEELKNNLRDDYEDRKVKYNYSYRSEIEKWQNKGEQIDGLYKPYSDSMFFTKNKMNEVFKINKKLGLEVIKIVQFEVENEYKKEQIDKDFPDFFKSDSILILRIIKSKYSDSTKNLLIQNFFKDKSFQFQTFCNDLSPHIIQCLTYTKYSHIAKVDKNYVLPGETLTAEVGIGEISRNSSPIFYINNKLIETDLYGLAKLKIKASSKKGSYKIPIKIIEQNKEGEYVTHTSEIEYKVIDTICKQ